MKHSVDDYKALIFDIANHMRDLAEPDENINEAVIDVLATTLAKEWQERDADLEAMRAAMKEALKTKPWRKSLN
ncbi:hypothetical protein [Hyphococcus sp.]|uniref:hypothetical protein n=1 Tax=Hyphococcus sp. TaxID=2038636 RepID=UPI003CCC3510